ncbi:MAG: response regulator [Pseudomonadota bacterium]
MDAKSNPTLQVAPSDIGQSIVRIAIVSGLLVWSWYAADAGTFSNAMRQDFFALTFSYWIFSFVLIAWSLVIEKIREPESLSIKVRRGVGIAADLGAISAYTAIAGSGGLVLYPVYLTTIIGYGYRFGLVYLAISVVVGLSFYTIAVAFNPDLRANTTLVFTYYLGLVLVPLYSASLLRRHQQILDHIREVNEARSRFIANMSHELRTPLHAIISVNDLLTEEARHLNEKSTADKLRMVGDSALHLLQLVNRVLDIASAEARETLVTNFKPTNIYQVFVTAINICAPKAREKSIKLFWNIDPRVPVQIPMVAEYLQEILVNTIGNAVKYTDEGYVHVALKYADRAVQLEIVDTGIGISSKLLPTIFEPFTLGDDSAARNYTGTGLGLTITKQYVESLGGEINFQSKEGIGTTCQIRFPIDRSEIDWPETDDHFEAYLISASGVDAPRSLGPFKFDVKNNISEIEAETHSMIPIVFADSTHGRHLKKITEEVDGMSDRVLLIELTESEEINDQYEWGFHSTVRKGHPKDLVGVHALVKALAPGDVEVEFASISKNVLIADDNETNLRTATMTLEAAGHRVRTVLSGEEALDLLENETFDMALLDMHMPGMSGIEVMQLYGFVETDNPVPIVILTADATETARQEAEDAGVAGFLTKPLRSAELRAAVEEYAQKEPWKPVVIVDNEAPELQVDTSFECLADMLTLGISKTEILTIIDEFEEDGLSLIEGYFEYLDDQDYDKARSNMHSLKGAAATVGATSLAEKVATLEHSTQISQRSDAVTQEGLTELLMESTKILRHELRESRVS